MSCNTLDKLIYMANQIAANLALDDDPVAATADHLQQYWDPRMKAMIIKTWHRGTQSGRK